MKPSERYERAVRRRNKAVIEYRASTKEVRKARTALIEELEGPFLKLMSRRELEVLESIRMNLTNKEIASKLNVAERTVKFHLSRIMAKFEVNSRNDLYQKIGVAL